MDQNREVDCCQLCVCVCAEARACRCRCAFGPTAHTWQNQHRNNQAGI